MLQKTIRKNVNHKIVVTFRKKYIFITTGVNFIILINKYYTFKDEI